MVLHSRVVILSIRVSVMSIFVVLNSLMSWSGIWLFFLL